MEATPRFVLPPRPTPPDADSKEHERWCRMASVSYDGGSFTTAYGNLAQVWGAGEVDGVCAGMETVNRASYSAKRTNKIGGDTKTINVPASTYKAYPKVNAGLAAGGREFTFVTAEGDFTARVTGDVQSLIAQLCKTKMQQYITFHVHTDRGAKYGPFTPLTILS